jgi:hypothetical protein
MSTKEEPNKITLNNVRISFPTLFEAKSFEGSKAKYSATFLLDKKVNAAEIKKIQDAIKTCTNDQWKNKTPAGLKVCLREGAEKEHLDGYGDEIMFISASTEKRPSVVKRDFEPISAEDGIPYAGSYVNATVRLWAQDNKYGKRVNAQLRAVMFVKDGAPFGEKPVDVNTEFADVKFTDDAII